MKQHIVYCYTSPSGKKYIGITSKRREKIRKKDHKSCAEKGIGFSFHQAIRKYGWENFKYEVLCYVSSRETACLMEKALIKEFNTYYNGYNDTFGGEGFFGLCGEESPLATTKEYYSKNSVPRCNFRKTCNIKNWNIADFVEIKDYIKFDKNITNYYYYIPKYDKNIKISYDDIEEFVYKNELFHNILSIDKSIEPHDIIQGIWLKYYFIKDFYQLANNELYKLCSELNNNIYQYTPKKQTNIEDYIILKEHILKLKNIDIVSYKCIILYFIYDYTLREIARILKISFSGVKNKIDKGLEMLRDYYKS